MQYCTMTMHTGAHSVAGMKNWPLEYVRRVITQTGMSASALAKEAGVSSTTLTRPLNNPEHPHSISRHTLEAIRNATGIPFNENEGGDLDEVPSSALVLVYDVSASAGAGALVEYEGVVEQLAFPPEYLRRITSTPSRDLAIISVKGDSMEPTLKDGDVVMVDRTKTSAAFDGLFVLRFDGALHVKRLARTGTPGMVLIRSDNIANYPSYEMAVQDVEVVGKVLWSGRKE